MALMVPNGPCFADYSDNFGPITSDDATGFGVSITAGASSADGTAVTLMPALAHDCEYLWLAVSGLGTSNAPNASLMDVLIDPAGGTSWTELISDLIVGFTTTILYNATGAAIPLSYHFPLWLPVGASLGARIRCQNSGSPSPISSSTRVLAAAFGGNKNPASWWCGQKVETIGTFDTANSLGQLHTPGASGAFSSWTNLGSATSARAGAVQWAVGGVNGGSAAKMTYDFQFGAGGARIGPRVYRGMASSEVGVSLFQGPIFCDIPGGTQLQVRGSAAGSLNGAQTNLDCAAYLVQ
jgi:hypothetical protein